MTISISCEKYNTFIMPKYIAFETQLIFAYRSFFQNTKKFQNSNMITRFC